MYTQVFILFDILIVRLLHGDENRNVRAQFDAVNAAVYYSSTSSALFLDLHEGSLMVPGDECFHKFIHKVSIVTYECP